MNALETARTRAVNEDMTVERGGENFFIVNTAKGTRYAVVTSMVHGKEQIVDCSCPHSQQRNKVCKHMTKVAMKQSLPMCVEAKALG